MTRDDLDLRWLASAAVAGLLCVLALVISSAVGAPGAVQVFTAVAWLAAIAAIFCAVRGGFDAGVHRPTHERDGSARQT